MTAAEEDESADGQEESVAVNGKIRSKVAKKCSSPKPPAMKVVIQNGASHALSRLEAECIVGRLPKRFLAVADSLVLYQGCGEPAVEYYGKSRSIGLFWSRNPGPSELRTIGVWELLIALEVIADQGHLPPKLSESRRRAAKGETALLLEECIRALEQLAE